MEYVYNTVGEYVAFVHGGHLFTPDCTWLGRIRGREVDNTEGELIGTLTPEGRVVRDRSAQIVLRTLIPRPPMRPVRPMRPKRHLLMERLFRPLEDVFLGLRRPLGALVPVGRLVALDALAGAEIVAHDGTFLGRLSRSSNEPGSLADLSSPWGDPSHPDSILNPHGPYGGPDGPLSAFNPSSATPPRLKLEGEVIAAVTINPDIQGRIDPNAIVSWLALT